MAPVVCQQVLTAFKVRRARGTQSSGTRRHLFWSHAALPRECPCCCLRCHVQVLRGEDGTNIGAEKLRRLRENSNYFRQRLMDMGCEVFGEWDSPVIPVMLYNPTKIAAFSRECLKRGVR